MTIYGRSEELVSRCVECDLAEPESLASLGGSAHGLVAGILSWHEHPSWAAVRVHPCTHRLIHAADPAWGELFCHIGIP